MFAILGISLTKTLRNISVSKSSWTAWKKKSDIPVYVLVALCNQLGISVGNFIGTEFADSPFLDSSSDVQEFMPDAFGDYITHVRHQSVDEACRVLGIASAHSFYSRYRTRGKRSIVTVTEFVRHCNCIQVSPASFIVNADIDDTACGYDAPDFTSPVVRALMLRIAELERQISGR